MDITDVKVLNHKWITLFKWKQSDNSYKIITVAPTEWEEIKETPEYCNRFDQRAARQHLYKHGPTRNNRWGCVFYVVRAEQWWNNGVMQPVSKRRAGKHTSA
jgi:hypothetical protein